MMGDGIPNDLFQIMLDGAGSPASMASVRRRVAALARYTSHPFQGARMNVRRDSASRGATRVYAPT